MALKHAFRCGENVISSYGVLKFNEYGFLTNMEELDASEEQLLELPNIVDAATFKDGSIDLVSTAEPAPTEEDQPPTDAEYIDFIKELHEVATEDQLNSEGYLEMDFLNSELRDKGWPILSGTKRKKLTAPELIGEKPEPAPAAPVEPAPAVSSTAKSADKDTTLDTKEE